ncbi:MAG: hypothetical protein IKQ91_05205 [Oscillospiraceae bacterium]|nr:hypothetical protein [Oscillospiraceae bacterium]
MVTKSADEMLIKQFVQEVFKKYLPALNVLQSSEICNLIEDKDCLDKDPIIQNKIEVLENLKSAGYLAAFEILVDWIAKDSTLFAYLFMLKQENASLEAIILKDDYSSLREYVGTKLYLCKKEWIRGGGQNENK